MCWSACSSVHQHAEAKVKEKRPERNRERNEGTCGGEASLCSRSPPSLGTPQFVYLSGEGAWRSARIRDAGDAEGLLSLLLCNT